jgi:membrane associated rhomboid family serine protease
MATSLQFDEQEAPALTRAVRVLLAINVTMLFLQWTLVSDADAFTVLGFHEASLQRTLWSTATYMFVHYGIWHLAVNMYALAVFGPRLEAAMGTRSFVLYYLWCGIGGAMAHLVFVQSGILVGSTAAVLGVMFASWQQWPREEVALFGVIPMRSWVVFLMLAAGMLGLGTLGAGEADAGGVRIAYLAHLGGLAFGWLYFRTPPTMSLDRLRQRISTAPDLPDDAPPRAIPRTLPRARAHREEGDDAVARSKAVAAPKRPASGVVSAPARAPGDGRAAELNRVLDKISSSGLGSLSSEERALLDEIAKGLRENI